MKKTLLALICMGSMTAASAQVLISEDFQDYNNFNPITVPDDAGPDDWVNYDADQLEDGNARPQDWFVTDDFRYLIEEYDADTNFMMGSSSWLAGFLPGNRNFLILPEIDVEVNMVVSWSSSTRQAPRYCDGYSLVVSPDADIADPESNFTDYLFRASQMVSIDGDAASLDYTDFSWDPSNIGDGTGGTGYLHADNFTNMDYLILDDIFIGKLEPHVMSLSDYIGETIRIAFLHDADDDNLIAVDDIVVETITGIAQYSFNQLMDLYPNPASDVLNLSFTNLVKDQAVVNIYNNMGVLVMTQQYAGNELTTVQNIAISDLAAGFYSIQVNLDNLTNVGSSFIKN